MGVYGGYHSGPVADIVDRRRALLVIMSFMVLVALALGLVVIEGRVTALALLAFTFAMGSVRRSWHRRGNRSSRSSCRGRSWRPRSR